MDFELEWELKLFREEQPSLFDEVGERYSATPIGDKTAKRMLNIINLLESALEKQSEQQSNCNLPHVSNNEVAVCDACGSERTIILKKCGKCGNTIDIIKAN